MPNIEPPNCVNCKNFEKKVRPPFDEGQTRLFDYIQGLVTGSNCGDLSCADCPFWVYRNAECIKGTIRILLKKTQGAQNGMV